ncbi:heavy metal transporter [Flavobacterium branchiophilum]|uniref:Copper chaperone CopZ n=1 Tax=Flavobacterium branchiophilum TaxID=55197 RepID=A0A543G0T3_9FLAO|nr:cation transporter [Flavobacterium branchiophilum]OXA72670.1 heavy metal transporter [Flavobacterium branchiophilum] [Flavobacterium branchiophilum NBRC 15030 = ATCC 35035]TQM39677.1 copper chaperone CopZ [Flavobacterium branchiophilum]GEM55673.1 hypothetical protein FB1_18940 [Flavobacterium branchiophilum NBRC 15030 = ATCC 35035]
MIQKFEVENIKCGGCMNSISNALQKIAHVTQVTIDKSTDTITVEGHADANQIIQKLTDLGYPEKGNNSLISKTKSFVSCAIGKLN